ncbi:epiphycan-like [Protopterus annectens]|uniref:epiphycan-like n=1 Tax=Protopterus annectens TaxID=7888 RepID=UPI001CFAFD84|nr:epiphycan-like [Protopterus annectens]
MGQRMKPFIILFLNLLLCQSILAPPPPVDYGDSELSLKDVEQLLELYDYEDGLTIDEPQVEIGTLSPIRHKAAIPEPEHTNIFSAEHELPPQKPLPRLPLPPDALGPQTQRGLPTCLLCTCLITTVYCDDLKLEYVPPLPKNTTHFYGRYNKIKRINKNDFANLNKLKKIDVTASQIAEVDEDAFRELPHLEELVIRENQLRQLPELPSTMTLIDASDNKLGRTAIKNEAFKDMDNLQYLYLADNKLDHIPVPLPHSLRALHLQNNNIQEMHEDTFCNSKDMSYIRKGLEDIRLDGNPINLSKTPNAYMCLLRLPTGRLI